ncbi:probable mediator of RNA polymerase II transcription subunit 26b [Macadamia integrifolia]|uniref:probable mediator of RNA polymerase II transcription subunit 26b n=1 Tax=Macadamia integrifolia TaxID=60698 RepID=UPI001C4EDBF9|nr:probable mediator of RNA polymerase II transcription subunit 26b [Macadamia integrifolia]
MSTNYQRNLIRGFDISTMATKSGSLDYWRKYFRSTNSDIFEVIEYAIMVAASDCPNEFKMRRDRIAERLYTCKLTRCSGCDRVELAVPKEEEGDDSGCKSDGDFEGSLGKESKVNSCTNDNAENDMKRVSNYSYDEAEALTEEIEEETQIVGEVMRIKEILVDSQDQSDGILFESLRRLQLMALTVDTLKATEIGKAVNGLRKHNAKQIRHLARTLIDGWKDIVDEWVNAAAAVAGATEGSPDSVNPSVVVDEEEEGLPSPPLDEGAFFGTQPTSLELSQFFDGMDDDGNPRNNGQFDQNREDGGKTTLESRNISKRKPPLPNESNMLTKDKKGLPVRKPEACIRQAKPSNTESGPGRPLKQSSVPKYNNDTKFQQKMDINGIQKRPVSGQQDKSKSSDEISVQAKLEAAKRKLQEGYQQAENAKKQRTIQVMELHDLPKQGLGHRHPPHAKLGNHNWNWANGRRH